MKNVIFGSWDQEIESSFTTHEPVIPTLYITTSDSINNNNITITMIIITVIIITIIIIIIIKG